MGIVGFDDAEALSGRELAVTTELTMSNDSVMAPRDAAVDRRGAPYILSDAGQVLIFAAAASLDGAATADVTLTITPAPGGAAGEVWPSFATTDLDDRLYIADASRSVVYVFDDASELRSGALRPDREIDSAELVAPGRLVLVER